ncbi:MAG: sensor histidine kinase [Eubacterium sp.]|nr:sensor histidine kinase [Eubacterium sp.]
MERAIDKLILYLFTLYLLCLNLEGAALLFAIYTSVALSAAMLWLAPPDRMLQGTQTPVQEQKLKLRIAIVLLDLVALFTVFSPWFIPILPVLVYDLILCRHWIGLSLPAVSLVSAYISYSGNSTPTGTTVLITAAGTGIALWLAWRNIRQKRDELLLKVLRDDYAEQQQKILRQNEMLLEARDGELLTAQLSERNRIAREIHDNVGHTLSRALLQVGALLAVHSEEPVHTELSGVRETLDSAMNSVRSSVHDLHDSSVDLESTVKQIVEPLTEVFSVSTEIDMTEDVPREIKYGLVGILREAVSNILRHSLNDSVQLQLLEHPGFYQMVIMDYLSSDGKLRDEPVAGRESGVPGIGLTNIENRVHRLGGTLQITEDNGFRVFVSVPKA